MFETVLVPEKTVVNAHGDSAAADLTGASARIFLLALTISNVVEQESLELTIFGSTDGAAWSTKPLATYPQKFYRGEYPFLLDLTAHPGVKFLRAHWDVARWGRGVETTMFEFGLSLKEIADDLLFEVGARAKVQA